MTILMDEETEETQSTAYLAYPASTLSPVIMPNDLTTFKTRGISQVQRKFQQSMNELREQYMALVDQFNWNKLVYEAKFGFEPIVGETYHLYELRGKNTLSMISPEQWPGKKWIATLRLDADGRWRMVECAEDFDLQDMVEDEDE